METEKIVLPTCNYIMIVLYLFHSIFRANILLVYMDGNSYSQKLMLLEVVGKGKYNHNVKQQNKGMCDSVILLSMFAYGNDVSRSSKMHAMRQCNA